MPLESPNAGSSSESVPLQPHPHKQYIPALDGVRGVAIALVLLTHFLAQDRATFLSRIFSKIATIGWVGVDLFFVLSGFLITAILFDAKGSPHFFRNFYARRTLRIFPLYYGVLLITLLILPMISPGWANAVAGIRQHQWSLWLYCSNIDVTLHRQWLFESSVVSMNHFWSLAVEEQFYLVWPLAVFLFSRRILTGLSLGAIVTALGLRFYWGYWSYNPMAFYVLTPCRMDALALGALVALASRGPRGIAPLIVPARWIAGIAAVVVIAIYCQKQMWSTSVLSVRTVGLSAQSAFFAAALVLIMTSSPRSLLHRIFVIPSLRTLGKYSYGIYVFHAMLIPLVDRWVHFSSLQKHLHSVALAQVVYLFVGCGISFALAAFSWNFYERQFLKLKRFFE